MTRMAAVFALVLMTLGVANARSEDGTLDFIRVPNNGQPALVVRGESFEVRAQGEPDIFVDTGESLIDMAANWRRIPGGNSEATIEIPGEFTPGLYNLVGVLNEVEDIQRRALLVLEEVPDHYYIAHIASPGMEEAQEASLAGAFSGESPLFMVVTGDLTANGSADEYRTLLDWLNTSSIPTIIAPGKRDSAKGRFGDYFDSAPHLTHCGKDVILAIGETTPGVVEDVSVDAGAYQLIRRTMKPARWSIGISGYTSAELSPRMQIILFVDTPLNALISGQSTDVTDERATVPWDSFQGPTNILAPRADSSSVGIQWVRVSPAGVAESDPPAAEDP